MGNERSSPAAASLQDTLQAFSLDTTDERILQKWSELRKATQAAEFASWMKENYWPLQSIGLRLVELAQLELDQNQTASAQAKMASASLMAGDLEKSFQDTLLRLHVQMIQSLDKDKKNARAATMLSYLRGRNLTDQHDYASALQVLQQARQTAVQLGDAVTASEIGLALLDVHVAKEEYASVVQEGRTCVTRAEQIGYLWLRAQALNRIADAERILGHDQQALVDVDNALAIARLQHDWRTQRDSHLYRARILYDTEKYREAEAALSEVAVLDAEHFYHGDILLLEGQMHLDHGEYGLAQDHLDSAVAEFERNQNAANVAVAYSTLSLLYMEQGDEQNALDTEGKALAIHEREQSARRIGWSQMNLGFIHDKFGNAALAQAALEQAIAQLRQKDEPRVLAQALVLRGNLQLRQKNPSANGTFNEALTWSQKVGFQYGQAGALIGQARLELANNATEAADSHLTLAEKIARELREPHLLTEVLFRRGLMFKQKQNAPAALDLLEQAIAALEQRFHSIARDSSRMQFFAPAQEIFDEAILLALASGQDERALQLSERARARALLESVGAAARDRNMAMITTIPTAGEIGQSLPDKCSVILYRVTADTLVSWAINKNSLQCRKLPISQEALSREVQSFRESLGAIGAPNFRTRVAQDAVGVYQENRRLGRELFRKLLEPWLSELHEGGMIYILPDGDLHLIPFGALVTPRDRFFEEESFVVRVPSLAMLHQGWRAPRPLPEVAKHRLLIVSNPAGDFPAAGEERAQLADLFARHKILDHERASYDAMQEELRSGAEVLHLSVHALADPVRPLNSYLELSVPPPSSASVRTERVFARQLLELDLSGVWLTVLNGCETASGRIVHGEGALSLVRLFALKRVAVVVATLWKNDDWQSLPLVTGFYRELKGGADPALALHRAKVAAIAELSQPGRVALPYFWSVFEIYLHQRVVRGQAG